MPLSTHGPSGLLLVAILLLWVLVKIFARLVVTAVMVGALVVSLVVAAGWLTDRPPTQLVDSAVATVTAGSTRSARDSREPEDDALPRTLAPARP